MSIEWGTASGSNLKSQYDTITTKLNTLKQHMDELDCDNDGYTDPADQFPCEINIKLDNVIQNTLNMALKTVDAVINIANCIVQNEQTSNLHEKMLKKVDDKINNNVFMESIIEQLDDAIASDDCDYMKNILNAICIDLDNENNTLLQMRDAATDFKKLQMDISIGYSQIASLVNCIKTELSTSPITANALRHIDPKSYEIQQHVSAQLELDKKPGEIIVESHDKLNEIYEVDDKINNFLDNFA